MDETQLYDEGPRARVTADATQLYDAPTTQCAALPPLAFSSSPVPCCVLRCSFSKSLSGGEDATQLWAAHDGDDSAAMRPPPKRARAEEQTQLYDGREGGAERGRRPHEEADEMETMIYDEVHCHLHALFTSFGASVSLPLHPPSLLSEALTPGPSITGPYTEAAHHPDLTRLSRADECTGEAAKRGKREGGRKT